MTKNSVRVAVYGLFLTLSLAATVRAQGPLLPPAGPGETMRSLEQIEPRTPIETAPYTITEPGSYFLTRNLDCALPATNGITVAANDVRLDLRGFTIRNTAGPGTGSGIRQSAGFRGLHVREGTVEAWRDAGEAGIWAEGRGVCVVSVRAFGNENGLVLGPDARVEACAAHDNRSQGVSLEAGAVIRSCTLSRNVGNGLALGPGGLAENVVIRANGHGAYLQAGALARGCTVVSNGLDGLFAMADNQVFDCVSEGNGEDGIEAGVGCLIRDCTCQCNGRTGINTVGGGNTLDANLLYANGSNTNYVGGRAGILVNGPGNLVIRNRLSGNQTVDVNIAIGNVVGTVMPPAPVGIPVIGSAGGGFGATDPYANVVY
jgi:hypothetical protein